MDCFLWFRFFVAMEPNEAVYFANPGPDGSLIRIIISIGQILITSRLTNGTRWHLLFYLFLWHISLSAFYTVADDSDGVLKVMRSYQYFAASAISDKVAKSKWEGNNQLGGYIWHTTGSGKTMTSFKSAQLIGKLKRCRQSLFSLMDRIELGHSVSGKSIVLADENESVQATENTMF